MRFDLSKFQGLPDKVGTVGTSGYSVENTGSVASPLTNSEWVQVGTLDGEKPDPVPTPDQVGTEWVHREALQTLAVPTVPTVPTQKILSCIQRFRDWWEIFDCEADSAEFNAGSPEATSELLPILKGLTWPDFEVQTEGPVLKLKRVCVRHYPVSDVPDEDA